MMKAMVYDHYGTLDVLGLKDIATPTIGDNEVLVRVHAAGIHVGDCFIMRGAPFAMRLVTGLFRPTYGVPGLDVAGTVAAVGAKVQSFKPGDAVFGTGTGSCAEYVRAQENTLVPKPENLTFEAAAAIPTSAVAALQALRDVAKLRSGQKLLINGASGGVGTFAVQIARSMGAEVTAVCSAKNVELVRSLGADHVIDYRQQDFTQGTQRYDVILDNIENHSLASCRRALTPTGTLVLNSGTGAQGFALLVRLLKPILLAPFVRQSLRRYVSFPQRTDLLELQRLAASGQLKPVIEKTYPLHQTRDALGHIAAGHTCGKVVVVVQTQAVV